MIIINNKQYKISSNDTVLDIARRENIFIPTLCFLKKINETSDCRMCLVEYNNKLVSACNLKALDNMEVLTDSDKVIEARKVILELIVSNHHFDCFNCVREGKCELKYLMNYYDLLPGRYKGDINNHKIDNNSPSIKRDFNKCILCKRCISTCNKIQGVKAIDVMNRGFTCKVDTINGISLNDSNCTFCGQCINNCPTGALLEKDSIDDVLKAIDDPEKLVFVQTAPSIRVALGEEFGMDIGTNITGKMVAALKKLNFDKVFDTNVGADFTIMEEANELVKRITNNELLPMITSCSPAWVRFIEMNYPHLLGHLSTAKSPHQMLGALIKTYYAKKMELDPSKIYVVSIMPCISKKYEIKRVGKVDGLSDVDAVLTTRELAKMIKKAGIDFINLEDSLFDDPLGEATGAAAIFGTSGGVMEAALRTAKSLLNDSNDNIVFNDVRGSGGVKEATVDFLNNSYDVVVASNLSNARNILDNLDSKKYHFIEIMACPGGCIMGGGQPIAHSKTKDEVDIRSLRASALYSIDKNSSFRESHKNPILVKIYDEYLIKPGEGLAHKLLHTSYQKRDKYKLKSP